MNAGQWGSCQGCPALGWGSVLGCFVDASEVPSVWRRQTAADLCSATLSHFCEALLRPGLTAAALVEGQLGPSPGMWLPCGTCWRAWRGLINGCWSLAAISSLSSVNYLLQPHARAVGTGLLQTSAQHCFCFWGLLCGRRRRHWNVARLECGLQMMQMKMQWKG